MYNKLKTVLFLGPNVSPISVVMGSGMELFSLGKGFYSSLLFYLFRVISEDPERMKRLSERNIIILSIHLNKRGTVKISVTGYLMFPKFHES